MVDHSLIKSKLLNFILFSDTWIASHVRNAGIQKEIFVGSLNFWAIFGAMVAQGVSDRFGRRMTFIFAAIGFLIGIGILVISNSLGMLLVGRMFIGFGVGIGLAIDPLYIAEITPAKHRGQLVTWSE